MDDHLCICCQVAKATKSTAGGLDGWASNELKALLLAWFSGLAPLGQRPLCVLPAIYRLWASLRLTHLRNWVEGGAP